MQVEGPPGPTPLLFRAKWGLRAEKKVFGDRSYPPPPPNLSQSLDDRAHIINSSCAKP